MEPLIGQDAWCMNNLVYLLPCPNPYQIHLNSCSYLALVK